LLQEAGQRLPVGAARRTPPLDIDGALCNLKRQQLSHAEMIDVGYGGGDREPAGMLATGGRNST